MKIARKLTAQIMILVVCLVGTAQGQVLKTEDRQEVEEDRVKHFRSLSSKDKLVFAFQDKELLASRAQLADLSNTGDNPHGTAFPAPRKYSTNRVYDTKLETKADGLSYKSRVAFDEEIPRMQGFLTNNFIPAVKKYCESGHLKVEFDSIEFSIAKRPNTDDLSVQGKRS